MPGHISTHYAICVDLVYRALPTTLQAHNISVPAVSVLYCVGGCDSKLNQGDAVPSHWFNMTVRY